MIPPGSSICTAHQCLPMGQFWLVLYNQSTVIIFEENIYLLVSSVTVQVIHLPEQTEIGLIAGLDLTVQAVHSCHSRLSVIMVIVTIN